MNAGPILAAIERELRTFGENRGAGTRVLSMNLVVVAESFDLASRYTQVVDDVAPTLLARAIVVGLDPGSREGALEGHATSVEVDKNAFTERISLTAKGPMCFRIPSVLEALLAPDVPIVLVWLGRLHAHDAVFEQIAERADRVIIDSEYTSVANLVGLASFAGTHPAAHIADLAWTRIEAWQDLLARFFDQAEHTPFAAHVERVVVAQASDPGALVGSEAALLVGWLGSRLGIRSYRAGGAVRYVRPDGADVTFEIVAVPRPEGVAPSTLAEVTVHARRGAETLKGSTVRELASGGQRGRTADADVVTWRLQTSTGTALEQRVRLGTNKAGKWLERTLRRPSVDPALLEAIAFAEAIADEHVGARTSTLDVTTT